MSAIAGSEFLQAGVLVALVVACALPLSGYLVDVMEGRPLLIRRALGPLERSACRLVGAREDVYSVMVDAVLQCRTDDIPDTWEFYPYLKKGVFTYNKKETGFYPSDISVQDG